jgi:hypothetical protein
MKIVIEPKLESFLSRRHGMKGLRKHPNAKANLLVSFEKEIEARLLEIRSTNEIQREEYSTSDESFIPDESSSEEELDDTCFPKLVTQGNQLLLGLIPKELPPGEPAQLSQPAKSDLVIRIPMRSRALHQPAPVITGELLEPLTPEVLLDESISLTESCDTSFHWEEPPNPIPQSWSDVEKICDNNDDQALFLRSLRKSMDYLVDTGNVFYSQVEISFALTDEEADVVLACAHIMASHLGVRFEHKLQNIDAAHPGFIFYKAVLL